MPTGKQIVFAVTMLFIGSGCQSIAAAAKVDKSVIEYNLYENGKVELSAGNYQAALDLYNTLAKDFPHSDYISQVQLESAYAHYKLGDTEMADKTLQRFIKEHDKHAHLPYAYYLAGLNQYDKTIKLISDGDNQQRVRTSSQNALSYFGELLNKFPQNQYQADAQAKTRDLLDKVIQHRVEVEESAHSATRKERIQAESKRSNEWLLAQPEDHYTLELISHTDYDTALKTAIQYQLTDKATIIKTEYADGARYSLIYGVYQDKHKAMEIGARLPSAILDTKPRLKQVGALQSEIKTSKQLSLSKPRTPASGYESKSSAPSREAFLAANPAYANLSGNIRRESWLLEQEPDSYSVQITGASSEPALIKYIAQNRLFGKVAYFKSKRGNKDWYSLLYGSYATKEEAQQASLALSQQLNVEHPWVRSYKSVQTTIHNAK